MITSVIFDMDGTIFNTEHIYFECYRKAAAEMGLDFTFELLAQGVGISREEANKFIKQHFGQDTDTDSLQNRTYALVEEYLSHGGEIPFLPGARETIELFYKRGLKLALASSNMRRWVDFYLIKKGLLKYFPVITTCEDVTHLKPHPEVYLCTAAKLKTDPGACLVFEDSVAGATAAICAGMRTCMVPNIKSPDSFVKQHAFKIYSSLEEVPADLDELLN